MSKILDQCSVFVMRWNTSKTVSLQVEKALKGLSDGTTGPDKVHREQLKSMPTTSLSAHISLAVV